jgi:heat shock protein HslJ
MKVVLLLVFLIVSCRPSNQISELVGVINERPLEETVWLLVELNGKQVSSTEEKPIFVIYHTEENKLNGFGGCNAFTGSYKTEGKYISALVASTRMFCENKMEIETEIIKALSERNKYEIKGSHLYLKGKGKVIAKFLAEADKSSSG